MEFNLLTSIFLLTSVLFLVLSVYVLFQYKFKKKEALTLEDRIRKYRDLIRNGIANLEKISSKYKQVYERLKHLLALEKRENELRLNIEKYDKKISELTSDIKSKNEEKELLNSDISNIKNDISIFSPTLDLINVGFFEEPEYLFDTSDRYKEEIKIIREKQKENIKNREAIQIPDTIAITNNNTYAKQVLQGQVNLMLKSFNIECDKMIGTVKPSNFATILERIDKLATDIEKSSLSLKCGFTKDYIRLKFKECELQYEYKLKETREREEQQIIREQMREEQKAIREFERALAKAQKEEEMFQDALEEAQKQLSLANENEKEKLELKILLLRKQLAEAVEKEERARSMAEQTKRGHVYIISNIGSFGENVYKMGLTRRLEPLDRVKELGDASVPFSFDVHAMIFSENAPELEAQLHREFSNQRVNVVNFRKEFFNVSLEDIKEKVEELTGDDSNFHMTAIAEEYHESKVLRSQGTTVT